MAAEEAERWGFFNRLVDAATIEADATPLRQRLATGPTFAHAMTKTMLDQEWDMSLDERDRGRGAGAGASACRRSDFERAYQAFVAKERPVFEGD